MIPLPSLKIIAALVLALGMAASHWQAYRMGGASDRATHSAEKLDVALQSLRLAEKTTRTDIELQDNADRLRRNKNATIAKLDADLRDALERLRDRPARPGAGSVPTDTSAGANTGCTGAQLYRPDAGFLVWESTRANKLLADLAQCQDAHAAARAAVN